MHEIPPLPFGKLRKLLASFNVMVYAGMETAPALEESVKIFALLLDKSVDEVDALPITMTELAAALSAIPAMCGIEQGAKSSGEAQVAVTDSTPSTVT